MPLESSDVSTGAGLAFVVNVSDELIDESETGMTKRKLAMFFLIAAAVFAASHGEQVRRAAASTTAPAHAAPLTLQR
jgi:hypothetical protein